MAVTIGKFEVGPDELCRVVTVEQEAADLFVVRSKLVVDGIDEEASFARFVNAALAFQHALRMISVEVEDVVDTVDDRPVHAKVSK